MKQDENRRRRLAQGAVATLCTALVGGAFVHGDQRGESSLDSTGVGSLVASLTGLESRESGGESAAVAGGETVGSAQTEAQGREVRRVPFRETFVGGGANRLPVVDGEVLAMFDPSLTEAEVEAKVASVGGRVLRHAKYGDLYKVAVPDGSNVLAFQSTLQAVPGVRSAFPNAIAEATASSSTLGQYRSYQWNLDRIFMPSKSEPGAAIAGITVAVLDTGVAYEDYTDGQKTYIRSPDLSSSLIVPGYDFVNEDAHPNDDHQHGTHIANTIAAWGKTYGVAPGVSIMPVKVLASDKRGTEFDLVEGIHYAVDQGADVINMSLSFQLGYFPSPALEAAVSHAAENHVVMVGSVGNTGTYGIGYPAAFPDVISVGASRQLRFANKVYDVRAEYSNYGWGIDMLAPGGRNDVDANLDQRPDGILAQTIDLNAPTAMHYWFMTGSSQATAHVSGAVALLLASGAAPEDSWRHLMDSSKAISTSLYNPMTGAGLLQVEPAMESGAQCSTSPEKLYYVNPVPRLTASSSGQQAVVRVQVLDSNGRKAINVLLRGAFYGSATKQAVEGITDANGVVTFVSPSVPLGQRVAIGFQAITVVPTGSKVGTRVLQVYGLSPAMAEVYTRMLASPNARGSQILYQLEPSDTSLDQLFSRSQMQRTWLYKPLAAGLRSGPLVVAVNDLFVEELLSANVGSTSTVTLDFPTPLASGWGSVNYFAVKRVEESVARLGSATSFLLMRFDPWMGNVVAGDTYPVVNAYVEHFLSQNEAFGNAFASSALGDGFASSALGDGFASSSLGDGFASSSLGDGFASSALGDAFASSALGDGFASSSLGDGFVSSSMGAGFASSSLGDGFASSSLGDNDGSGGSDYVLANSKSVDELDSTDVSSMITEEDSFPAEPTPEP